MVLDNSQINAFWKCPEYWKERYFYKIVPRSEAEALTFGTRVHNLLECRLRGGGADVPHEIPSLEAEARVLFGAYCQQYPVESFTVVDTERVFKVELPGGKHFLTGKFDGVVDDSDGIRKILEHKTEKRGSKRNLPETWAVKAQASLYCWAASQIYQTPIDWVIVDVLTRQSPAGREGPAFKRFDVHKLESAQARALRDATYVADCIEALIERYGFEERWPTDSSQCVNETSGWKCDYYKLHSGEERTPDALALFDPAKEYLNVIDEEAV